MHRAGLLAAMLAGLTLGLHPGTASATATGEQHGVASASEASPRTPPYDFGCIALGWSSSRDPYESTDPPCSPESGSFEPARQGLLQGATYPWVGLTYSLPPFPILLRGDAIAATGIHVDVPANSLLTASATVRTEGPVDAPSSAARWVCLGARAGSFLGGYGCKQVRVGTMELRSDFGGNVFYTDPVTVFVYLVGCSSCSVTVPATVRVERISSTISPIPTTVGPGPTPTATRPVGTLTVSVLGQRSGRVVSGDRAIRCGRRRTECSAQYRQGAKVELTAVPGRHSRLKRWIGCDQAGRNTCTVTVRSGDEQVTAVFRRRAS